MSFGGGRTTRQQDQSNYLPEDQVQQPQQHAGIMSDQRSPLCPSGASGPVPASTGPSSAPHVKSWSVAPTQNFARRRLHRRLMSRRRFAL